MEIKLKEGQEILTSDDHKLGRVAGTRDDCVVVETGHVFKTLHAIPASFLHEQDGEVRATVSKEIVDSSPKLDGDDWSCEAVLLHYGMGGPYEVDPDPNGVENAETVGTRAGIDPPPHERIGTLGETEKPEQRRPGVRERMPNPADPTGGSANYH